MEVKNKAYGYKDGQRKRRMYIRRSESREHS